MDDLRNLLNEKQYEAATSNSKYLRIIAGAGSGKTRVLTYRIAYLIDQLHYYPSSILAITFTNKAAEEIRNRVEEKLNMGKLKTTIATFHAYGSRILREECKLLDYPANFTVLDDDDQKKIVKDIMKELEINDKMIKISTCLDHIEYCKNHWITPKKDLELNAHNYYKQQVALVYQAYEEFLKKNYSFDFDDLILKPIEIFDKYPEIMKKWQRRLRHILVDEFQDVDPNQYKLLTQLAGKDNEITVVGDPDQTIYTWRGADINIILEFEANFAGTQTISLEQNYRSTGNILNVANRLIQHNHKRIKKNLFTNAEKGFEISTFYGENEQEEAKYVVKNILDLYDGQTIFYKDFAILYRTNAQSSSIEQELMQKGIKYKVYGGIRFYRRSEVKDCIAYLRIATNLNDDLSCVRLIENTKTGVGKTTLEKLKANATTENTSIYHHLKNNSAELEKLYKPAQGKSLNSFLKDVQKLHDNLLLEPLNAAKILDDFLHSNGYLDMLISYEQDDRIDNVHQFINQMKAYFKEEDASLEEFVCNVTLMSSQDEMKEDSSNDYVRLMTIHTAKGLEFNNVFVYGLVDMIFPSSRTIQESEDGIEEERRLFYVAITRAKKRLFLSTSGGYSYNGARLPSRFLREIKETAKKENVVIRNDNIVHDNLNIRAGSMIKHDVFGEGIVINSHDGLIDVIFKDSKYGKKTLNASHKFVHLI
ncbi:MAG: UvrD-helicase domain-containing protein [Erysipelotrichaceae bacterium]|nr:UvrD-helicase domain-containing protein [Erysipelotrichaceae bacterium]